jgi:hypothetical protein
MSRRASENTGPRFTPAQVKTPDICDGSVHPPELLTRLRGLAVADRLGLDGLQHAPTPPALNHLEYVCDQDDLTAFAGMPALMQFAYATGLADWLGGMPIKRRRDAVYPPGKVGEVTIAILAAGLERVSHVDDVTYDPGLCAALGLKRLPDQATVSRFFSDAAPETVAFLRAVNHAFSAECMTYTKRQPRLIVDVDTRNVGVYGKQEGATRSPRNDGDPMFTFEAVTLRNGRDLLCGELLEGATHPAPLFRDRLGSVLAQVAPATAETIICADGAWYADYVMEMIEDADADKEAPCACKYAIRAQTRGGLQRKIVALGEESWERYDEFTEVAEVTFAFTRPRDEQGITRTKVCAERRYVVTRQLRKDQGDTRQQTLLDQPRYAYRAIVTSLDWTPKRIVQLYNGRATVESILKEGALGFRMDSLPSQSFAGNGVFCQLLVMTYNLVNMFRRLCLPEKAKREQVMGMRRHLLAVPGRVAATDAGSLLRCSRLGPHVEWLAHLTVALGEWLPSAAGLRTVELMPAVAGAG